MSKNKPKLKEVSSMQSGAVMGTAASVPRTQPPKKRAKKKAAKKKKKETDESILRRVIRENIKTLLNARKQLEENISQERNKLRNIVRYLIQEAKKDVEISPHASTAINLLEELLKQILPGLETNYKTLTTSKEQRESFRAHVINAASSLLETDDINKEGGEAAVEQELLNLEEENEEVEEDVKVGVVADDTAEEDKFIDIESSQEVPEDEEEEFGIAGQDETGRAMAQDAFNDIEKNISETYAILHDEEDEKIFEDYLITNLKLYFDKWEKELGAVTEPTTDAYETEKSKADDEMGAELDAELGGE